MKLNCRNHTKFALVALTLIALCVMLCACSDSGEEDATVVRNVYLTGKIVFTDVADDTAYVHVSFRARARASGLRLGQATSRISICGIECQQPPSLSIRHGYLVRSSKPYHKKTSKTKTIFTIA